MTPFLTSLIFVVLAEMGDKTQLLAMAFSCKYRWQTVMWAVFWATALNHLFAAGAGGYLAAVVPMIYIKVGAAISFIIFGLWTIRGDELHGEDKKYSFSPFWTVAIAFFIAEMGDKTQLATISLAVEFNTVIPVWMGTTLGMMVSNAIGIIFGIVMGKKMPERFIKWASALIFIAFGIFGVYEALPGHSWHPALVASGAVLLLISMYFMSKTGSKKNVKPPYCGKE